MHTQIQVKPQVDRLLNLLSLIEDGMFKIPTFQRDFIWEDKEKIDLFDSISKEYPIGSILLWRPKEKYANKFDIGPYTINSFNNTNFYYILDGFQRLSTLFGCLTNPQKTQLYCDKDTLSKKFSMVYDLEDEAFLMKRQTPKNLICIPVYKLIDTYEFLDFIDKLRVEFKNHENLSLYIDRAKKLSSTLLDYRIPYIEIIGGQISDAVDIFSRVNSKGIEISPDWMLSALSSNEESGFNLGDIFNVLLDDLDKYNYGKLKREVLVQCIQNSFGKIYYEQTLEELAKRPDFQEISRKVVKSIKNAIKFLYEELLVIDKKLLPYPIQLIFLVQFFNKIEIPTEKQKNELKKWFWITTYSNYFTIYSLSKIKSAYIQFNRFIENVDDNPIYYHNKENDFVTADLPKSVSSGSVRSKAFQLFLLNWSYKFLDFKPSEIESYQIMYLDKSNKNHASLITNIKRKLFVGLDQSEIQSSKAYNKINFNKEQFFLGDKINRFDNNGLPQEVLNERLRLIEKEECNFVEKLNITYQKIT